MISAAKRLLPYGYEQVKMNIFMQYVSLTRLLYRIHVYLGGKSRSVRAGRKFNIAKWLIVGQMAVHGVEEGLKNGKDLQ